MVFTCATNARSSSFDHGFNLPFVFGSKISLYRLAHWSSVLPLISCATLSHEAPNFSKALINCSSSSFVHFPLRRPGSRQLFHRLRQSLPFFDPSAETSFATSSQSMFSSLESLSSFSVMTLDKNVSSSLVQDFRSSFLKVWSPNDSVMARASIGSSLFLELSCFSVLISSFTGVCDIQFCSKFAPIF
ncbi:hypothetical protein LELG_05613 [Lodderomyces elongisporus NRRL YB-4239]|uniref:Uncharacterized protein n=1 Tax=Lodderomyces elongisporus (strain ATCC 11503 / CBS 2605 / JCM 1781 / NBRC 1676 / NRRL YB-4239) TaxID=379508 RepID=A5E7M4_LODEL|nr:hypothetical protein LELG_05613 [Lodderomyces elongisporus NRRL YB-4239]